MASNANTGHHSMTNELSSGARRREVDPSTDTEDGMAGNCTATPTPNTTPPAQEQAQEEAKEQGGAGRRSTRHEQGFSTPESESVEKVLMGSSMLTPSKRGENQTPALLMSPSVVGATAAVEEHASRMDITGWGQGVNDIAPVDGLDAQTHLNCDHNEGGALGGDALELEDRSDKEMGNAEVVEDNHNDTKMQMLENVPGIGTGGVVQRADYCSVFLLLFEGMAAQATVYGRGHVFKGNLPDAPPAVVFMCRLFGASMGAAPSHQFVEFGGNKDKDFTAATTPGFMTIGMMEEVLGQNQSSNTPMMPMNWNDPRTVTFMDAVRRSIPADSFFGTVYVLYLFSLCEGNYSAGHDSSKTMIARTILDNAWSSLQWSRSPVSPDITLRNMGTAIGQEVNDNRPPQRQNLNNCERPGRRIAEEMQESEFLLQCRCLGSQFPHIEQWLMQPNEFREPCTRDGIFQGHIGTSALRDIANKVNGKGLLWFIERTQNFGKVLAALGVTN
ncbi:hypothetical protein CALCODRAFT_529186 [Calocera cornea HHB12733]|uniref:Uncharacterized protein n=1 Tax=Calocera cornea HHB12733 TaxID=1353952 RepID=A0A165DQU7_9BASI|nr:hypothetical protein CALCODRAFT_529186 [Calocera cornea HHB12733]